MPFPSKIENALHKPIEFPQEKGYTMVLWDCPASSADDKCFGLSRSQGLSLTP